MDNIVSFDFNSSEIRTLIVNDEPWFVASDVCRILGFGNPRQALSSHVDEDDVQKLDTIDNLGRTQQKNVINESGLYALIFGSKLPTAKEFKRWITSEVIPSIRKHGAYMTPEKIEEALLNPDMIIRLATDLKNEQEERVKLQNWKNKNVHKVDFANDYEKAEGLMNLQKAMKTNGYKPNKGIDYLRGVGVLISNGRRRNEPKQEYLERGYFELKSWKQGERHGSQTLVTAKGLVWLRSQIPEKYKAA